MLRNEFKQGYRQIIELDGTFFKSVTNDALFAVIREDSGNRMFPIAWAVVEVENQQSWSWFFEILLQDMSIDDGFGWSFILNQQKVYIYVISLSLYHLLSFNYQCLLIYHVFLLGTNECYKGLGA